MAQGSAATTAGQPCCGPGANVSRECNSAQARATDLSTYQRIFAELRLGGYLGGYDAVRRYERAWAEREGQRTAVAYVPPSSRPGESSQSDRRHEIIVLGGVTTKAKVAQVRLCRSRMPFARACLCQSQQMVFDAMRFYGSLSLSLRSRSPEIP